MKEIVLVSYREFPGIYEPVFIIKRTSLGVECIYLPMQRKREGRNEHHYMHL